MKPEFKLSSYPYLILGAGGLGFALQQLLYRLGQDEKGLLIHGHWAGVSFLILTAAVLVAIFCCTRSLPASGEFSAKVSVPGGIGCLLAAAALFFKSPTLSDTLSKMELFTRLAAQLSLCILAFCRFTGKKSHFLTHGLICLYLAVRMIGQYQNRSSDPQLMDYAFFLLAHVALMIFAYQLAAADAACGSPRSLWRWGLVALYLCCCAPCDRIGRLFLLLTGIWVFTSLCAPFREEHSTDTQEVTP